MGQFQLNCKHNILYKNIPSSTLIQGPQMLETERFYSTNVTKNTVDARNPFMALEDVVLDTGRATWSNGQHKSS